MQNMMKAKYGEGKAKEKETKIGGSYEKEQIPDNLADINSLRSIFQYGSVRKDSNKSDKGSETKATPTGPHDEDTVDYSQPSMDDLLTKFRQLELETARIKLAQNRTSRKLKADEYIQRSASLDRYANLTYERKIKETAQKAWNGMTIDDRLELAKSESGKGSTRQQSRSTLGESLSKLEVDSCESGSKKSSVAMEYDISIDSIKRSLGIIPVKPEVVERDDCEEFPSKGTVQALLYQWKSLEKSGSQKKKKRVRFGVDSSWLPQNHATSIIKSSKQIKSCLKSTAASTKDRNCNRIEALTSHESFRQLDSSKQISIHKDDAISKPKTVNSLNGQNLPPDVVRQVSETSTKPPDELPPPSNTKTLLEKFRAMQVPTSVYYNEEGLE